jgi:copper transport protein
VRPSPSGAGGRRVPRLTALLLFLLGWLLAGVAAAIPASAHAELISADPASGTVLDGAPSELTLRFSESVTQVPSAMKLLAADGTAVPLGRTVVEGNTLRVPMPGSLPDAGYVFVYRVISADSHPVAGALTFTVGASATAASSADIAAAVGGGSNPMVSALAGINRWGGYAGVVLLIGVPAFIVLCRRDGAGDPLLRGLTAAGGALVALTALVSLPLQAARSSGSGLGGGFEEIDTVLDTTYGEAALARLVLVVVLVPALWVAARSALALVLVVPVALAVLVTFARSGHPAVGEYPWATTAVDVVHFGAVAVWIGGLVVLGTRLLPRPPADCAATLARWSPVAMGAVGTLAVTGSIQAWRELRSLDAFFDTTYGRWILVKIAGLVLLLAVAEFGRRRVQAMNVVPPRVGASLGAALADDLRPVDDAAQLRRSVGLELALAAAVLAATSALVVTTPGSGQAAHTDHSAAQHADHHGGGDSGAVQPGPDSEEVSAAESVTASVELPNEVRVEVAAAPASAGSAVLTLAIRSLEGEVVDPPEVTLTASLAEAGIAPITLTAVRAEAGRFTVDAASLLLAGLWKITVTVRTTETDAGVGSVEIPLSPA